MVSMRVCVFETNSSSTHALLLCNDETYQKLVNEEMFIDYEDQEFITLKEFIEEIRRSYEAGRAYPQDARPIDELESASVKELTDISEFMYLHIVPLSKFYGAEGEYYVSETEVVHAFSLEWEDY